MTPTVMPEKGDYFVSELQGIVGLLVRIGQALLGDWSRYSHAGLYVGDGMVVAAQPGGVEHISLETLYRRPGAIAWHRAAATPEQRETIAAAGLEAIGKPYGWLTYPYLALGLFRFPRPRLSKVVDKSGARICSQLVDAAYAAAGVELFDDGRKPGDVTPGDLAHCGLMYNEPGRS